MTSERKRLVKIVGFIATVAVLAAVLAWAMLGRGEPDDTAPNPNAATPDDRPNLAKPSGSFKSTAEFLRAEKAVIIGTVRDEQGRGVAGASVCAWPNSAELRGADDAAPRCTTSESDGHYRIEKLWPVATGVSASAAKYRPARWSEQRDGRRRNELRLVAGQERQGVDVILKAGGVAVRGVVKDISGGVIAGAIVSGSSGWWFGGGGRAVAVTDDEGSFELWTAPGELALRAQAEGYADAQSSTAAPTERAELFLTPESTISGIVVRADTGAPVPGATVTAQASGFFGRGHGSALTDDDGRFRIAKLQPGIYDVLAVTDDLYGEAAEQVHLGLAQAAETSIRAHPAFTVRARVVIAETDQPCEGARVHFTSVDYDRYIACDEAGEVLIRAILPGEYQVAIECDGYVSEPSYDPVIVADAHVEGLEWTVHTGLAIRGVVVDSSGAELEGMNVSASHKPKPNEDPRGQRTSQWGNETEADGSFTLGGLLPGSYELDASGDGYPSLAEPVLVELGETADLDGVRLVLPGTGTLEGIVRDETGEALDGVTVSTNLIDGRAYERTQTGDDGRFRFERLRTGSHRVVAQLDSTTTMRAPGTTDDDIQGETVAIVEGGTAELELIVERHSGVIRGRVLGADGGPVSDAFIDATRLSDSAAAGASRSHATMRWGWDRQPVLSDQDGSFELRELAEGSYLIRAYREGGGEALLEGVAVGSTVELTIVETGRIAGVVAFADGGNPERFEVKAYAAATRLSREDQFFRTDGRFELRELPPGKYDLTVSTRGGSAKLAVELAPSESIDDLVIELAAKITITGRLVDADTRKPVPGYRVNAFERSGMTIFSSDDPPGERREISDADGRFEVADVPTGKVQLWIITREFGDEGGYGWTRRLVNLPKQPAVQDLGEIELLASRLGERQVAGDLGFKTKQTGPDVDEESRYFEVAVIRPGGPADGSGLAVGDRIAEVDGRKVTGTDSHRYERLTAAPEGTVLELTIEDEQTVSITIGPPVDW